MGRKMWKKSEKRKKIGFNSRLSLSAYRMPNEILSPLLQASTSKAVENIMNYITFSIYPYFYSNAFWHRHRQILHTQIIILQSVLCATRFFFLLRYKIALQMFYSFFMMWALLYLFCFVLLFESFWRINLISHMLWIWNESTNSHSPVKYVDVQN